MHTTADGPDVVLVGSMGSGKTTTGQRVAAALGLPFHDGDAVLRARTGCTAAELAATVGPDELHRLEAEILVELLDDGVRAVVAPAASTIEEPACRRKLLDDGTAFVAWLHADVDVLAARVAGGTHRPFVAGTAADTADTLRHLAERRDPLYRGIADLQIDVTAKTPAEAAALIVDAVSA